jgi:hypothetical protein
MFTFLQAIYLGVKLLDHMATLFNLLRNCQTFPKPLYHLKFPPAVYEDCNVSRSSAMLGYLSLWLVMVGVGDGNNVDHLLISSFFFFLQYWA